MADLSAAIAAAREALEYYYASEQDGVSPDALRDLLAALDAQAPVAWQTRCQDGNGDWYGWSQERNEDEAIHRVSAYADIGIHAERRSLYLAPPDLVTQLDHARRRIRQLTIQLGEVMKAPPAQPVAIANFDEIMSYGGMPPAPQPQAEPVAVPEGGNG